MLISGTLEPASAQDLATLLFKPKRVRPMKDLIEIKPWNYIYGRLQSPSGPTFQWRTDEHVISRPMRHEAEAVE